MRIAVYCGSDFGNNPEFADAAKLLGRWIGESGNSLIYGGGDSGLMGTVAKEVHDLGAEVIGVVPGNVDFIKDRPHPYVSELIVTENMSSRKQTMLDKADAFVALPGGTGTIDEISEAITLTKIGVFDKKCILFNYDGFYEPFKQMFETMENAGFLKGEDMKHVLFASDIEEIEAFFK